MIRYNSSVIIRNRSRCARIGMVIVVSVYAVVAIFLAIFIEVLRRL
ncbi:hypothetical protein LCGC14_0322680 [marine sediment metagenome]|uniref:Uncharacterized protein n=1 Tax=marine sediment metagenome TaxID=412755 RepID=A0A0F9TNZ4_9ZZZZ